jgi:hypothetical protein
MPPIRTRANLSPMSRRTVIVGISAARPDHADAITLGALLARPVQALRKAAAPTLDRFRIGSDAREPQHVVLGAETSGALLDGLDCTLLVVPRLAAVAAAKP